MENTSVVTPMPPDTDLFTDNQPMNDEELSRLHESTLQMFRSNKIGPKNAFDIVLIDYLPAIFEATTFDDDHINNFQSVGTTLETSAKIYAARIDSLYSETRKAQSIIRSTNDTMQRIYDEDENEHDDNEDEGVERRNSPQKKIHLALKRKKSVVTDRQKLLRKNRNEETRPIMLNQFFLSAMNNDNVMLSELYEKISDSSIENDEKRKKMKCEQNDLLSSSLNSNDFTCEHLYIDTTNTSVSGIETNLSPLSDVSSMNKTNHFLTPTSLNSSSILNLSAIESNRSRTNSIVSETSILTNAASLLTDTPDEYSYLDSSKVHAFIDGINRLTPIPEVVLSPTKIIRKRRLSLEYPFPFLVEQVKKQRLSLKKLREEQLAFNQRQQIDPILRPPSPEYNFTFDEPIVPFDDFLRPTNANDSIVSPPTSKRQRNVDFRHLQSKMQKVILKTLDVTDQIGFSDIFSQMNLDDERLMASSDIGICFAALLNNAVRSQLVLQTNEPRDDIFVSASHRSDHRGK